MADVNLGRVAFVPRGLHNLGTSYAILDTVVYAKNGYCCIKPVPANSGILPTNTEYFVLLVEKGEKGDIGPGGNGPKGDPFTYEDFTTEQLEAITSGISAFKTVIREQELKIGTIRLFGLDYDLFQMIVDIPNIPTTLNEEATFILSSMPLGFNLYLKTNSLVVAQEAGSNTSDFYNESYKISRLFIDSDLCTKVSIKCIQAVTTTVKASIQLEYIRDFGETLQLTVTVPGAITPSDVNLSFPKLKYNKSNVASITVDDSCSIWNNIFSVCNKKWVDDEYMSFFAAGDIRDFDYHRNFSYLNYSKTTGHYPNKFIEYTDGAGVKHRYAVSVAVWGWRLDCGIEQPSVLYPWVEKEELKYMQEFGCSATFHDVQDLEETSSVSQAVFNSAVRKDSDLIFGYTGRRPKIMQVPNGDINYIILGWACPDIQYQMDITDRSGSGSSIDYHHPFSDALLLNKKSEKLIIKRDFWVQGTYEPDDFQAAITANAALPEVQRKWLIYGLHRPSREAGFEAMFNNLESLYGMSGNDSLWFPSIDEYLEYWFMTTYGQVSRSVVGQTITFKIFVPCNINFWFKSISCLLSGVSNLEGVTVSSSENCNGTSFAVNGTSLLVNLDFNGDLVAKAEKYLAIFEANPAQEYAYEDALYFIQQLKVGLKESYETRLQAFVSPPTLSSISINSGAATTGSRTINIGITLIGSASEMLISEDPNFAGAAWVPFTSPCSFTLSEGFSEKTVYVILKNSFGESSAANDSIEYIDTPLTLSALSINGGASATNSTSVIIEFSYTGTPTHYMLSEDPAFVDAVWLAFAEAPAFILSSGYALKTVYGKLKNSVTDPTNMVTDTIQYAFIEAVVLTSVEINSGAASTSNRTISIGLVLTGTPTHYRVGETPDLSAVSWIAYSSSPISYQMSATLGAKTVYVQVQNSSGVSAVRNDSITLEAAPAGVVCSFIGSLGVITYPTVDGSTINVFDPGNIYANWSQLQLKSKAGASLQWFYEKVPSFYQPNYATNAALSNLYPTTSNANSGNTGVYPDEYLAKAHVLDGAGENGAYKGRMVFTLPVGSYKFQIVMCVQAGYALEAGYEDDCLYRVDVGGVEGTPVAAGAPGFTGVNNVQFNAEINFTVATAAAGNVNLYIYNPINWGYRPAINLLEITKTA